MISGYGRPSESNAEITSASPSNIDSSLSVPSLQRKISLGDQLLRFFEKVEGKGSFIRGNSQLLLNLTKTQSYINMKI